MDIPHADAESAFKVAVEHLKRADLTDDEVKAVFDRIIARIDAEQPLS